MTAHAESQREFLSQCRLHLSAAERLIRTAAESLGTFYVSEDGPNGPFTGFLRDSLADPDPRSPSTGGLSVPAYLFEVEPQLSYVDANIFGDEDTRIKQLLSQRNGSRDYLLNAQRVVLRKAFGEFNPFTTSIAAYLSAAGLSSEQWSARTKFFNALNLAYFLKEPWPTLKDVDKAHPYVAYNVIRAVSEICEEKTLANIDPGRLRSREMKSRKPPNLLCLNPQGSKCPRKFESLLGDVFTNDNVDRLGPDLRTALASSREESEKYLWKQNSYAPGSNWQNARCPRVRPCRHLLRPQHPWNNRSLHLTARQRSNKRSSNSWESMELWYSVPYSMFSPH